MNLKNKYVYFKNTYMGVIIAREFNPYLKKNILTIKTPAGTTPRITEPRQGGGNWSLRDKKF